MKCFVSAVVSLVHRGAFLDSEKQADDSTLVAVAPSPAERVAVTESMNRDINRVSVWFDLWGRKLNVSKTKTMIVSRSRRGHPQ